MKEKIKTTSFWLEIIGVVMIVVDTICGILGVNPYSGVVEVILMSLGSILVLIGVVTKKSVKDDKSYSKEELLEDFEIDD